MTQGSTKGVPIDTDPTMANNSNQLVPSQAAVVTYVGAQISNAVPNPMTVSKGGTGTNTLTGVLTGNGTSPFTASAVTQHDVLVGGSSNAITSVAPSATSGVPLISQGAAADPAFGTAVVAGGGTGAASFSINGPVIAATTTTGALSSITLGLQQFLVGNTSAAPTAKALSIVIQVFTTPGAGTYTPTAGMVYCIIECVGGGGAGGGAATTGASTASTGGGGGAGEYARGVFSAATIGGSKALNVGAAGTGNTGTTGGTGGTSSVGSTLISAIGGTGGATGPANAFSNVVGGLGGTGGTGGSFRFPGGSGLGAYAIPGGSINWTGMGGDSYFGGGAPIQYGTGTNFVGITALNYGAGGGGALNWVNQGSTRIGGNGSPGIIVVTEFVIA